MKNIFVSVCLIAVCYGLNAQSTNDFLIGGAFDLIKTDNTKLFNKVQTGFEVNYFIQRHFAVGAGGEFWTERNSFTMGARWYPTDNIFVRFRGLIGVNDTALGVGWAKPIDRNFRFEAMGDLYLSKPSFAFRAGVGYVINYLRK